MVNSAMEIDLLVANACTTRSRSKSDFNTDPDDWETTATNRTERHGQIPKGATNYKTQAIPAWPTEITSKCRGTLHLFTALMTLMYAYCG